MKIHDITRRVENGIPVWPGDTRYDFRFGAAIADGASVNAGRVTMSVHTGTHTDAPLHIVDGREDIASVPLEKYIGPCQVVDVRPKRRGILPELLPEITEPRVLLRTYARRPKKFDKRMAHATPELATWLAERGVVLLGTDTDSMDAFESKDLPAHHRLIESGIAILEGLDLSGVAAGRYELVAAPLRLVGADASPVRALLIER